MTTTSPTPHSAAEQARRAVNLIFLLNGLLTATWAVNIPGVRSALHLDSAQLGLALLCVGIGSLLTMPFTGQLTARFGSGRVTAWLAPLCMLALIPPFFAPTLPLLMAALLVLGMVMGALDVAMNAQGVSVEKALGRPIMSRLHAYFSLGGVLGAGLGALLVGTVTMQQHALLVGIISTLATLWAGRQLIADPSEAAVEAGEQRRAAPVWGMVALLGTLALLGMMSEGANYDWAALYFTDVLHTTGGVAGLGYGAFVAAMTLGRWFGDAARARLGSEALVRGGALLTALGLGLALLVPVPWVALLGFALSGLGLSNVVPVLYSAAGYALAGRGIALVASIGYGGFLLGPPLIGFVAQHAGLSKALLLALLGAVLVAVLGGRAFALLRQHEG